MGRAFFGVVGVVVFVFFLFFLRVGVGFSDVVGFVGGFPSWAWAS